jgi:DNA invertase Pin-like site-specific DNA recombinase
MTRTKDKTEDKAKTKTRPGISYRRFSDPGKQAGGDSRSRQARDFARFCERHNLTPATFRLTDSGLSGFRGEHRRKGAMGRLEAMARAGEVPPDAVLVIEGWDRLSRERPDKTIAMLSDLLRAGLSIGVCRLDDIFSEDDFGTHKFTTLAVFIQLAYQESRQKSERCSAAWAQKVLCAQEGQGQPPRRKDGRTTSWLTDRLPAWVEVRGKELVLNRTRAEAVRRIFELAAAGLGCRAIATRLDREAVPSFGTAPVVRVTRALKALYGQRDADEFITPEGGSHTGPCPLHEPGAGPTLTLTRGEDGKPATLACSSGCDPVTILATLGLRPADLVPRWDHAYIATLLVDRRCVGEFQLRDGKGRPLGDPLQNYLPAAVTQGEWDLARASKADRPDVERQDRGRFKKDGVASPGGRGDGEKVRLFGGGLIRDALSGGTYRIAIRRGRNEVLIRSKAVAGFPGEEARSFPLPAFEKGVLSMLREINPEDVLPREEGSEGGTRELESELAAVRAELVELRADLDANGYSRTLGQRVRELEGQEAGLKAQVDKARLKDARPVGEAWQEFGNLVDVLDRAEDPADARLRLRAALRRVVEGVWLLVQPQGHDRLAAVQVRFVGGGERQYLIWHRRPRSNGKVREEGWYRTLSFLSLPTGRLGETAVGASPWDLSTPGGAGQAEALLDTDERGLEVLFQNAERHDLP